MLILTFMHLVCLFDRVAFQKAIQREANLRFVLWCGAAGFGLALLTIGLTVREEKKRARAFRLG